MEHELDVAKRDTADDDPTTCAGETPLKDGVDDVLRLLRYASGLSTRSRSTGREASACSSCPTFPSPWSSERRALGTGAFANLSTQQQGLGEAAGWGRSRFSHREATEGAAW